MIAGTGAVVVGVGMLVLGALLVALGVWVRSLQRADLAEMAAAAARPRRWADPWEEPRIVATYGGVHDVEEDEWR